MILRNTRTFLLQQSAIGELVASRVFPNVIPQGMTLPAIRLTTVSGSTYTRHGTEQLGKTSTTVQVDAYASNHAEAERLAEKIRIACHQYKGAWGGIHAASVHKTDERTFEDMPADGSSAVRRVISQDFRIIHTEAIS